MPFQLPQIQDLFQGLRAAASHGTMGVPPAENFGCVKKGDTMGQSPHQEGPVHFTAALDQQADDLG